MIRLFVEQVPASIEEMKAAYFEKKLRQNKKSSPSNKTAYRQDGYAIIKSGDQ